MSAASFATPADVAARWRPLTDAETDVATVLCLDASNLIRAQFPGIDGQLDSGAIDPDVLTAVTAGMVKRAMIAPSDGISQQSETVGPFSQSQSFANPLGNVFLTAADTTMILGYRPSGQTGRFANTTIHRENCGPGYIYTAP